MDPDPASMLIYKLLQLNCLAVYWQSNDSLLGTSPPDDWMVCLCRVFRTLFEVLSVLGTVVKRSLKIFSAHSQLYLL